MIGYKGFNKDMTCTKGAGKFKYEPGKWYEEKECQTARNGFHFVERPLEVLRWYPWGRFFTIEAAGDIDEDDNKLSCTKIRLVKELSRAELYAHEVRWMLDHWERLDECNYCHEKGEAKNEGDCIIVIGKEPQAKGVYGSTLFLIQTKDGKPVAARAVTVDSHDMVTYYVDWEEVCCEWTYV